MDGLKWSQEERVNNEKAFLSVPDYCRNMAVPNGGAYFVNLKHARTKQQALDDLEMHFKAEYIATGFTRESAEPASMERLVFYPESHSTSSTSFYWYWSLIEVTLNQWAAKHHTVLYDVQIIVQYMDPIYRLRDISAVKYLD